MIKPFFNGVVIVFIGALSGAFLGIFAVGLFWYYFPESIIIYSDNNQEWVNKATVIIFLSGTILGVCGSFAYIARSNARKYRGNR